MKERLQDRELSIINLFWAVCLKWRQIIIISIICGMLAGVFSYYKSYKAVSAAMKAKNEPITAADLQLDDKLTETTEVYLEYLEKYKEQKNYNDNSLFMQLNANGFYKGEVVYYIDNHYKTEYPVISIKDSTYSIANAYLAVINSNELQKKAAEIIGLEGASAAYVADIIDASNRFSSANSVSEDLNKGVITIAVYANEESDCEKLLTLIADSIESQKDEIAKRYGNHDCTRLSIDCFYTSDPYVLQLQRDQIDRLRDYYSRMKDFEKQFTEDEAKYIEVYKQELLLNTEEELNDTEKPDTDEGTVSITRPSISKKLVLVALLGGAFFVAVLYALGYIFNRHIRIEDQPDDVFSMNMLGIVINDNKRIKGLDKVIIGNLYRKIHLFEKTDALEMAAANIRVLSRKFEIDRVYVVGAASDSLEKELCNELAEMLKESNVELEYGKSILYDAESLDRAAEIGTTIVICTPGISTFDEIAETLDICISQKTRVLGLLMMK